MATGDQADIAARVRRVLPPAWFPQAPGTGQPTASPVLDAVLAGLGAAWAAIYALYSYAVTQTRIATATDCFLDLVALDFFGTGLARRSGETDDPFRSRIDAALFQPKDTRAALVEALTDLTGRAPVVFEPVRPADTGGYGSLASPAAGGGFGYGAGPAQAWTGGPGQAGGEPGGYGTMQLPFQFFVTAFRPIGGGIAWVQPYGAGEASPTWAPGAVTVRQASATYIDQDGVMQTAGPGVVRPLYSGATFEGLLVEAAATNLIVNSNAAGGGTGTAPTGWNAIPGGAGITITVIGTVVDNGVTLLRVNIAGTASGDEAPNLAMQPDYMQMPLSPSLQYVDSFYARISAGSLPVGATLNFWTNAQDSGGSYLSTSQPSVSLSGTLTRFTNSITTPVDTAFGQSGPIMYIDSGVSIDLTLDYGAGQVEVGSSATSYIPTTTGAATRDADALSNTEPGAGGYGAGAIEYADQDMVSGQISDADIYAAIAGVMPASYIAWTNIEN